MSNVLRAFFAQLAGRQAEQSLMRNGRRYLTDLHAASVEAGVRPFLMWGTLLGYVREKSLMSWDGDIDVGILPSDYAHRAKLISAMAERGYRLTMDEKYKFRFEHLLHGLWIDVDLFFPWRGDVVCCFYPSSGRIRGERFPAGAFSQLDEVTWLDGIRSWIPSSPEPILETIYGNWRVRDPGYTGPKNHFEIVDPADNPVLPT